jgi:hypothetical protein
VQFLLLYGWQIFHLVTNLYPNRRLLNLTSLHHKKRFWLRTWDASDTAFPKHQSGALPLHQSSSYLSVKFAEFCYCDFVGKKEKKSVVVSWPQSRLWIRWGRLNTAATELCGSVLPVNKQTSHLIVWRTATVPCNGELQLITCWGYEGHCEAAVKIMGSCLIYLKI